MSAPDIERAQMLAQEPPWGYPTMQQYWRRMAEIRHALGCPVPSDAQYEFDEVREVDEP
jgi:hypothetical protein